VVGIKRMTFLIDPEGKIRHIFKKVDTARHAEQVLETLAEIEA
jgi:peroxiredoxin Q/BCP